MKSARILVVDDEEVVRRLCERVLAGAGHEVRMASSVGEALSQVEGPWDLLITDLKLPGGSGVDVAGGFKARHPGLRVLLITGSYELAGPAAGVLPETVDRVLLKPFPVAELRKAVEQMLEEPR